MDHTGPQTLVHAGDGGQAVLEVATYKSFVVQETTLRIEIDTIDETLTESRNPNNDPTADIANSKQAETIEKDFVLEALNNLKTVSSFY